MRSRPFCDVVAAVPKQFELSVIQLSMNVESANGRVDSSTSNWYRLLRYTTHISASNSDNLGVVALYLQCQPTNH